MGSKTATKLVLLVGLLMLLATSAAFIFLGSYIIHLSGNITDLLQSSHVMIPTIIILSIGIMLVFLVLIGFFGCILEKKVLLKIFFGFLFLIFIIEISGLIVGIIFKYKIKSSVESQLLNLIKYYNTEISLKKEIDYIQSTMHCCGVKNYTDWIDMENGTVPNSCCRSGTCKQPQMFSTPFTSTFSPDDYLPYHSGCSKTIENLVRSRLLIIIVILASIMVLQVVSLVASCGIFRDKRRPDYEPFSNGYHV